VGEGGGAQEQQEAHAADDPSDDHEVAVDGAEVVRRRGQPVGWVCVCDCALVIGV